MKLKKEFITHNDGDQQMMIDVSAKFSGLIRSNATAAEIINMLKEDTTEDRITAAMLQKYDVEESVLRKDIRRILDTLRGVDALDE